MKKIAIISGYEQFGYHTDTYNYCIYLKDKFNITYISVDKNLPRIDLEGINVKYIKYSKIRLLRGLNKIIYPIINIIIEKFDLIFITHFEGCSFIKSILKNKKFILDIRTTEISGDKNRRKKLNDKLKKDITRFENITVISEGIRKKLNIPQNKSYILPLGAKTLIESNLDDDIFARNKLSLIYVGTFKERRIEDTIKAFNKLSNKYNGKGLEYNLIGFFDDSNQEKYIKKLINKNKFGNIKFLGRIKNEELGKYFIQSNIGVSYIPKTEYFEHQPPTKTYEYLFNGLFTIATNTIENTKIVNEKNGVIIEDTEDCFYKSLDNIYSSKNSIIRKDIIKTVEIYDWKNICNNLEVYINSILED